jgi:hypothetical protein
MFLPYVMVQGLTHNVEEVKVKEKVLGDEVSIQSVVV